jgi:hypothetical protein
MGAGAITHGRGFEVVLKAWCQHKKEQFLKLWHTRTTSWTFMPSMVGEKKTVSLHLYTHTWYCPICIRLAWKGLRVCARLGEFLHIKGLHARWHEHVIIPVESWVENDKKEYTFDVGYFNAKKKLVLEFQWIFDHFKSIGDGFEALCDVLDSEDLEIPKEELER